MTLPRLPIALMLALGAHGLLFTTAPWESKRGGLSKPLPRVVTMTLARRPAPAPPAPREVKQAAPSEEAFEAPQAPVAAGTRSPVKAAVEKIEKKDAARTKKPVRRPLPRTPAPTPEASESLAAAPSAPAPPFEAPAVEDNAGGGTPLASGTIREATPLYRINTPPRYPRVARRRGYEGTVILEVLVGRDGTVGDLRIATPSGHSVLDKAAAAAVRKWLFEPGRRGESATEMWVRVPIRFALE